MEVDRTLGGLGLEVWCDGSQAEARKWKSVAVTLQVLSKMM
jgi:hypothetical protein